MQFSDFIGQTIRLIIPRQSESTIQNVKLLGVDIGVLWIESQDFTNSMLQKFGQATAPNTIAIFVPYHEIAVGFASLPVMSLNEKAFGAEDPG